MKIIATILFYVTLLATLYLVLAKPLHYKKEMVLVDSIDGIDYLIDLKTNNIFSIDSEGKEIGTKCIVTFSDNNTDFIEDDVIKQIEWKNDK